AGRVFAELGAIVEPADPFSESPMPIFRTLALAGFWALLRAQTPQQAAVMDPALVEMCKSGEAVTQQDYVAAIGRAGAVGGGLRPFFDRYDLLLSPTMPIPAAYAEPRPEEVPHAGNSWSWVVYTYPCNLTKNPSASIPCSVADGLPVGLMVTGPLYGD